MKTKSHSEKMQKCAISEINFLSSIMANALNWLPIFLAVIRVYVNAYYPISSSKRTYRTTKEAVSISQYVGWLYAYRVGRLGRLDTF